MRAPPVRSTVLNIAVAYHEFENYIFKPYGFQYHNTRADLLVPLSNDSEIHTTKSSNEKLPLLVDKLPPDKIRHQHPSVAYVLRRGPPDKPTLIQLSTPYHYCHFHQHQMVITYGEHIFYSTFLLKENLYHHFSGKTFYDVFTYSYDDGCTSSYR